MSGKENGSTLEEQLDAAEVRRLKMVAEGQHYFIVNLSHSELSPRSGDGEPAFRVCRSIRANDFAEASAQFNAFVAVANNGIEAKERPSWHAVEAHKPVLIAKSYRRMNDAKYVESHVRGIDEVNAKRHEFLRKEFKKAEERRRGTASAKPSVEAKTASKVVELAEEETQAVALPTKAAAKAAKKPATEPDKTETAAKTQTTKRDAARAVPQGWSGVAEVPLAVRHAKERFAVVITHLDVDKDDRVATAAGLKPVAPDSPECVVRVLAMFETLEEAKAYIKGVAALKYPSDKIDAVEACEWIHPFFAERHRDELPREYSAKKYDEIVSGRRQLQQERESLESTLAQEGVSLPVVEVHPDGTISGKDMHGRDIELAQDDHGNFSVVTVRVEDDPVTLLPRKNADADAE